MLLQILSNQNVPPKEFIRFWSCQYQYANAALYDANIGKPLTPERVLELFEWKNGRPLSGMKKLSIRRNYLEAKESIPMNGTENELQSYLTGRGGAIWRIFWLHCHEPSKYPIYDQHVHRAMAKLEGWEQLEIPNHNPRKVKTYLQNYLPFWKKFSAFKPQAVDRALWAYGKFLSLAYKF